MTKFVALLRGVNVGGRIIKMADLKICFEKAGYKAVKTYLQSGNAVFESTKAENKLKQEIEQLLEQAFNYPAKVIVVNIEDLKAIIKANPFTNAPADYHQYVIFFENGLEKDFVAEEVEQGSEDVRIGQKVAYWKVEKGETLKSERGKLLTKTKY